MPKESDWKHTEEPLGQPADGQILIKVHYVSLDPAMRGWINEGRSYIEPVGIGDVMRAGAAGRVVESKNEKFVAGDFVVGAFGVQEYALSDGSGVIKVDTRIAPLPVYLGTLGMPGFTAYFGLLDIGQPKEGETLVVSAAAGAVGSVVGQIGKIKGCRVVGIAGGPQKCQYVVNDLGFDAAIDYKQEDVPAALRKHCSSGIDIYFDNVGGDILDAALAQLNRGARIPLCGAISQYNHPEKVQGPKNYLSLLAQPCQTLKGFIVFDFLNRYPEAASQIAGWLMGGKLKSREDIVDGLTNFPDTFLKLFKGENFGKLILKVAEE